MSTTLLKKETLERKWYVIDAAGKPLGRTAVIAANILRGKHKTNLLKRNHIRRMASLLSSELLEDCRR